MPGRIVITGIGVVTPLGEDPREVLRRIEAGDSAAAPPSIFNAADFGCPIAAVVTDFDPLPFVTEAKMVRLMNRDAQMAVVAARRALRDAGLRVGIDYAPEQIGLFGATGLAGLPLTEVAPLLRASTTPDGRFDLSQFGQAGLRAVSPILSFKILGNMPVCFVGINEGIRGPNAIYTPWEGNGAQAIEAGVRALQTGDACCALVGGCDVKVHELAFLSLAQQGAFDSWRECGAGLVPAEGAAFLVLEYESAATARGARTYARLAAASLRTRPKGTRRALACAETIGGCFPSAKPNRPAAPLTIVSAANGDPAMQRDEAAALSALRINADRSLAPKPQTGDLFAAAAFLQVGLGALLARQLGGRVLANCFGHGSEQAAFLLEGP